MMKLRIMNLYMITVLIFLSGCASVGSVPESPLSSARESLLRGNEPAARKILERIVALPPVEGVTDEALFRLALLRLRSDVTSGQTGAATMLDRLANDFPESLWARQAAPLSALLLNIKALNRRQTELKLLKERNSSLNREKRYLQQTIERLKDLDVELEHKGR